LRYLTSAGYAVRVFQPFLRFWQAPSSTTSGVEKKTVSTLLEILELRELSCPSVIPSSFQPFLRFWAVLRERGIQGREVSTLLEILAQPFFQFALATCRSPQVSTLLEILDTTITKPL